MEVGSCFKCMLEISLSWLIFTKMPVMGASYAFAFIISSIATVYNNTHESVF